MVLTSGHSTIIRRIETEVSVDLKETGSELLAPTLQRPNMFMFMLAIMFVVALHTCSPELK